MEKQVNIALFIDGDNVNKNTFQTMFDEIKVRGRICIKRIYFDFHEKLDEKWKQLILSNGIESITSTLNKEAICHLARSHGLVQGRPTRGPRAIFGPPRHFEWPGKDFFKIFTINYRLLPI